MSGFTVDPTALHVALRRIAQREAAAACRLRNRGGFLRRVFTPRHRREHLARLGPSELVHNNLAS